MAREIILRFELNNVVKGLFYNYSILAFCFTVAVFYTCLISHRCSLTISGNNADNLFYN